ncbi:hypothetical protein JD969_19060 [Planctomycetota bacterium]|nr:hypothetical protein JD969_19060 [Planctomycetota bacterium]
MSAPQTKPQPKPKAPKKPVKKQASATAATKKKKSALTVLLKKYNVHCPNCNYNLRGSENNQCPECGKNFDFKTLTNHRREKLAPYLTILISFVMILPSSFTNWQRFLMRGKAHYGTQWTDGKWQLPVMNFFEHAIMWSSHLFWFGMPLWITLLIIFRRKFTALPKWLQWSLAIIAAVLTFLAYRRYQFWYYTFNLHGNRWPPSDLWYLSQ